MTEILARGAEIRDRITELAADVAAGGPDPVVVGVLKGSVVFLADLLRRLPGQPVLDFLAISPYRPGTGRVRLVKDLDTDISGRRVVLVEDIVDTGLKLGFLLRELERRRPARLEVCTLLDRPARRILPVPVDHVGFEVPDQFLVGYGLGYAGRYRDLDLLAVVDHDRLVADPDAYVDRLYPTTR